MAAHASEICLYDGAPLVQQCCQVAVHRTCDDRALPEVLSLNPWTEVLLILLLARKC